MKKYKKLTVLLVVLAIVCIATIAVSRHEIKKEQIKETDEVILEVPSDSVTKLSWTCTDSEDNTETSLSFTKQDGDWQSDDDATLPIDNDKIADVLSTFESFGAGFIIEEPESLDQYGLDKPVCSISFTADDKDYTVLLGGFSTMDQERYVSIGDDNVYLVTTDPYDTFNKQLEDFTKTDDIPELEDAVSLKFGGTLMDEGALAGNKTSENVSAANSYDNESAASKSTSSDSASSVKTNSFTVSYDVDNSASYSDEDVYYSNDVALDSKSVRSYLKTLSALDLSNCVNHTLSDDELNDYGLDKPLLTAEITYDVADDDGKKTGEQSTLSFAVGVDPADAEKLNTEAAANEAAGVSDDGNDGNGTESGSTSEASSGSSDKNANADSSDSGSDEDAEEESINSYIRFNDSELVYQLSDSDYDALTAVANGKLYKKDLLPVSFDDVDSMTVTLDGSSYTFTGTKKLMGGRDWSYDGNELVITDIREAIEGAAATDVSDETPTLKKEISISFATENKNHPTVNVDIYRYNGSDCILSRDDGTYQLISRSSTIALCEAIYAVVLG